MKKPSKEMILAMPAGREIDDLVAELVMGWQRRTFKSDGVDYWHIPSTAEFKLDIPYFSISIAAAWQVVEKFNRKEWDIYISSYTEDGGEEWGISLIRYTDKSTDPIATGAASDASLPLAICRAALLAALEMNWLLG